MQNKTIKITIILLLIFSISPAILRAEKEKKQMRIKWATIEGVQKYRVEIKDEKERIVIDEETEATYLDFILPVGKYQLRIGSMNKFNKVDTWSDWESIEIKIAKGKYKKPKEENRKSKPYNSKRYDLELVKLGVGYSYYYLLPKWDNNYGNSYINAHLNLGIYFGKFDKLNKISFFRYFGTEFELHYMQFEGKRVNNVISDLKNIVFGLNIYFRSNFKFPVNLILRMGGGLTYTIQDYEKYSASGSLELQGELQSLDFYYKPEFAVEFRAAKRFYIEMGTGFLSILYKDETMYSLKPFIMFGFTF